MRYLLYFTYTYFTTALQEHDLQELWQQGPDFELVTAMYTAELARVRYLLRAYLRVRLMKLERFVMYILDTEEEQEKVSDEELEYAKVRL